MKCTQNLINRLVLAMLILACLILPFSTPANAQASTITVEYTINANNRDAWSGNSHTGNPNNEVRINGYNSTNEPYEFVGNDGDAESAGMEFQVAIPQGSTIQNAFISVRAGSFQSTSPTGAMQIHLYNVANAQPFANGFFGDLVNHHPTYAQTASWNANATWTNGSVQQTPNISSLVQLFASRSDYVPGNYIGFAISGGTIQSGKYYGWEDFFANGTPAKLTIRYSASSAATTTNTPAATATNQPAATTTPAATATNQPATATPTATATNQPAATATPTPTNTPAITPTSIPTNIPTATQRPNPTATSTSSSVTVAYPITSNNRDAMSLNSGGSTQEIRISGYGNGSVDTADYVSSDSEQEAAAMEFSVSIPAGAKITNASITVKAGAYQHTSPTGAMSINLYNSGNAAAFVNGLKGDLAHYQPIYGSAIMWSTGSSWGTGSVHQTPNLAAFVQTFVNRSDYKAGNYIGFVITAGTLTQGSYYGWQDATSAGNGAVLTITYTK